MNCHDIFFSTFHCSRLTLFTIKPTETQRYSNTTHIFFRKCTILHSFSCSMWRSIHVLTLAVFKLCILCTLTVGHTTVLLTGANKRKSLLSSTKIWYWAKPPRVEWTSAVTSSRLSSPSGTLISGSQVSAQEVHVPLSVSPSYLLSHWVSL